MISITRSLARQLRAVFRRAGLKPQGDNYGPRAVFQTGPDGLRVWSMNVDAAIQYHEPGQFETAEFHLPLELLDACQGKQQDAVTLEARPKQKAVAAWNDRGIPQVVEYDAQPAKKGFTLPALPESMSISDPAIWPALHETCQVVDHESTRYALGCVQLRGKAGQMVASDGRQILIQGGFQFGFEEDLLVPEVGVMGCPELATTQPISIGRTEKWLTLVLGNWSVWLRLDTDGRFPKLDNVYGQASDYKSRLHLSATDAEFLANALPRLPKESDAFNAVTLDLNGQAIIRAHADQGTPPTEVVLSAATLTGDPVVFNTDRKYLARGSNWDSRTFTSTAIKFL